MGDGQPSVPSMTNSERNTAGNDIENLQDEDDLQSRKKPKFKTVDKIHRKKRESKKKRSKSNYVKRNLQMISSALFISGAVGMIIVGAIRFSEMDQQTVHDVILNFYFLFIGVILAFHEFEVACVVSGFRFLQYHWGKCILCLFLCSISFSNNEQTFIQYVTSLYFFVVGCCFLVLSCADR